LKTKKGKKKKEQQQYPLKIFQSSTMHNTFPPHLSHQNNKTIGSPSPLSSPLIQKEEKGSSNPWSI